MGTDDTSISQRLTHEAEPPQTAHSGAARQLTLALLEPQAPRLRDGVVGPNAAALAALAAHCRDGGPHSAPSLLLWGQAGVGRSFWLQAWARALGGRGWLCTAESLVVEGRDRLEAALLPSERRRPPVWLLDGLEDCSDEALSLLFQALNESIGRRMPPLRLVLASDHSPAGLSLRGLRTDLTSRLANGLVFELRPLDDEALLEALRAQVVRLGWTPISDPQAFDSLLRYICQRLPRDLGLLMRLLRAADQAALQDQRRVTLPLVRDLLEDFLTRRARLSSEGWQNSALAPGHSLDSQTADSP